MTVRLVIRFGDGHPPIGEDEPGALLDRKVGQHGTERPTARWATPRGDGRRMVGKAASKGNEAQGGQAVAHLQHGERTVRTLSRSKALRDDVLSGIGNSGAAGNGSVGTVDGGERAKSGRATTVVTRHGCEGEESSGGYETTMRGIPRSR